MAFPPSGPRQSLSTSQIGTIGENHAARWLVARGYKTNVNTKLPGSTDIEADGQEKILVQVKTAVHPMQPSMPSSDEIRNIKSRATKLGRTAYVALVLIDGQGNLIGDITWSKP